MWTPAETEGRLDEKQNYVPIGQIYAERPLGELQRDHLKHWRGRRQKDSRLKTTEECYGLWIGKGVVDIKNWDRFWTVL